MNSDASYWRTGEIDSELLLQGLGDGQLFPLDVATEQCTSFYDTFDWRFWLHDQVVMREDNFYSIYDIDSWHEVSRLSWNDKKALRRCHDLPKDSDFAQRFNEICGCRSLINLGEFTRHTAVYSCNDARGTPLYRVDIESLTVCQHKNIHAVGTLVRLRKLGRNPAILRQCVPALLQFGFAPVDSRSQVLKDAFKLSGRLPGDYSMKISTVITADMPSGEALVRLFRDNFRLMRSNEHGICKDIDIEFLHDFRVALRRSRTLLASFDDLLHTGKAKEIREDFSKLAQLTNPLRDCDVLLDYRDKYTALLPAELRPGMVSFFQLIEKLRGEALQQVRTFIESPEYEDFCHRWQKLLDHPAHLVKTAAGEPTVKDAAGRKIYSCFRKVVKGGRAIDTAMDTDDTALHQVRIRCKKLRYLIEFFAGIFPESAGDRVEALKKLQTTLGDYNDLVVQISTLMSKIETELSGHRLNLAAAASVGGLVALLARDKNILRDEFKGSFNDFASPRNVEFFKKYFRREPVVAESP